MPKISIIIAMYNIEQYIAHCIKSCVSQLGVSSEDYEILIINDGSTDDSLKIAEQAIKNSPNASIITRPNGGLSAARNTGIKYATGNYLWFVDGDDAIDSNAIRILLSHIDNSHCDAYIINFSVFDNTGKISTSQLNGVDSICSGLDYHFKYKRILPMMAWLTIYNAKVLVNNEILFTPNIFHEDLEFSIRAHHVSSTILFLEEDLYFYRVSRNDSIMNNTRKDNTKSLVSQVKIIESFKNFFKDTNNAFVRKLYGMCATSFFIRRYDTAFVHNENTYNLLRTYKYSLYRDMWLSYEWKRMLLLLVIILFPSFLIKPILKRIGERSKLM